jgi:hypothetical protein
MYHVYAHPKINNQPTASFSTFFSSIYNNQQTINFLLHDVLSTNN